MLCWGLEPAAVLWLEAGWEKNAVLGTWTCSTIMAGSWLGEKCCAGDLNLQQYYGWKLAGRKMLCWGLEPAALLWLEAGWEKNAVLGTWTCSSIMAGSWLGEKCCAGDLNLQHYYGWKLAGRKMLCWGLEPAAVLWLEAGWEKNAVLGTWTCSTIMAGSWLGEKCCAGDLNLQQYYGWKLAGRKMLCWGLEPAALLWLEAGWEKNAVLGTWTCSSIMAGSWLGEKCCAGDLNLQQYYGWKLTGRKMLCWGLEPAALLWLEAGWEKNAVLGTWTCSSIMAGSWLGEKCCAGDLNLQHYYGWLFSPMLYQLGNASPCLFEWMGFLPPPPPPPPPPISPCQQNTHDHCWFLGWVFTGVGGGGGGAVWRVLTFFLAVAGMGSSTWWMARLLWHTSNRGEYNLN